MDLEESIHDYLRAGPKADDIRNNIVSALSESIRLKQCTLLQLVSKLGDYITETDATIRSNAMRLLQGVLGSIPVDILSGQHVTVMTQFFCDRLSDEVCLAANLAALTSISRMKLFAAEDASRVIQAVLQKTEDAQTLPQRTRFSIYTLIDNLMARKRPALRALGKKFIDGYVALMSGEKDPRNLMLAFSIMRVILAEFDVASQAADLFDVVYCYFPITFRPPPDEPSAITTDNLKVRLRECLCATPHFAPYLIPALIEKLNAVAVSVKKDTLLTLQGCCAHYSSSILDTYTSQLWAALKFEIIQSEDGLLEEVALQVLTAITLCFCSGLSEMPRSGPLSRWLQPIVVESLDQLREPELKSAKPCGKILYSVAKASSLCLDVVVRAVMPGLVAVCQETTSISKTTSLFEVLQNLIHASINLRSGTDLDQQSVVASWLGNVKGDVLDVLLQSLLAENNSSLELRVITIDCLVNLVAIPGLLTEREMTTIIGHLTDLLLKDSDLLRKAALDGLTVLAKIKSTMILNITFPALLAHLPYEVMPQDMAIVSQVLDALAQLSCLKNILDCLIVRILSRADACVSFGPEAKPYLIQLLDTLRRALKHYSGDTVLNESSFYDKLIPHLYSKTFRHISSPMTDPEVLQVSGEIINVTTRSCDIEKQRTIAADIVSLYLTGGINGLVTHATEEPRLFSPDALEDRARNTLSLFTASYAGLRREIPFVAQLNQDLLLKIIQLLPVITSAHQSEALLTLLALILNKCASDEQIIPFLELFKDTYQETNEIHIKTLLWISKSLILRGHKEFKHFVSLVIDLLARADQGLSAAQGFQILIGPHLFLNQENHGLVKRLHKQKFYAYAVPEMLKRLDQASSDVKQHYLIALSIVVANTPQSIYVEDFANILPVLLQCVALSDSQIKLTAITTIDAVGSAGKEAIGTHLSSIIPSLLECTRQTSSNTPRVRIASLHLLGSLIDIVRPDKLQPFKAKIIRNLADVLDDRKRIVRNQVVTTRQRYFQAA